MGTANLLESIRKTSSVKVCIIVTSDKCYENKEVNYDYKETDPLVGYDPYSSSKGAVELITSSYRNSFFNTNDFGYEDLYCLVIRSNNLELWFSKC